MGGNATFINSYGDVLEADRIDLSKANRSKFTNKVIQLLKELNKKFYSKNKVNIWVDESKLVTGELFNGSSSFIFDKNIPDSDILKYKNTSGDVDVIVPKELKQDVFDFLQTIQGKTIIDGVKFIGIANSKVFGETIICMFNISIDGYVVNAQIDFEFLPIDNDGKPSEWSKFSHSSSFDDVKLGLKGVGHKYLITAIVGASSVRDDIVIVTNKSTTSKYRLKKMHSLPRMLKFSVDRGIRLAYDLMYNDDGTVFKIDGKDVYRELKTNESNFITTVREMYKLVFNRLDKNPEDENLFWSMKGVVKLMNKYMSKKDVQLTMDRLIEMLWGNGNDKGTRSGQVLEERSYKRDFEVKNSIYSYLVDNLKNYKPSKSTQRIIDDYYDKFKQKKSIKEDTLTFKDYLHCTDFIK